MKYKKYVFKFISILFISIFMITLCSNSSVNADNTDYSKSYGYHQTINHNHVYAVENGKTTELDSYVKNGKVYVTKNKYNKGIIMNDNRHKGKLKSTIYALSEMIFIFSFLFGIIPILIAFNDDKNNVKHSKVVKVYIIISIISGIITFALQ